MAGSDATEPTARPGAVAASRGSGPDARRSRQAGRCSGSRIQRVESGDIKVRPGDVLELMRAYGIPLDSDLASDLSDAARDLREIGWWQRLGLSSRYATYIAYEEEATDLRNFEPTLVPGLLQTGDYARAVASVGRETETEVWKSLRQPIGSSSATRRTRTVPFSGSPRPHGSGSSRLCVRAR